MAVTDLKITYICHSGFLVETKNCYYLFDYYKGRLPALDPKKPILVFASHSHPDHYNPEIFPKLASLGMEQVTAVLSKDISKKKYPSGVPVITVIFYQQYELPWETRLETLLSTDQGVAFLIRCPDGVIYHAGDLNDWVWAGESPGYNRQMTGSYKHEIDLLASRLQPSTSIDAAFIPLDPRQEKDYARGMLYFLKKIKVKAVYPMHYWERSEIIGQFLQEYPEFKDIIHDTEKYSQ